MKIFNLNWGKIDDTNLDTFSDSRYISIYKRVCIIFLAFLAISTSYFDELGVMKHIWIAALSSFLVYKTYQNLILPAILKESLFASSFKANSFVVIASYILGSLSGPGLLTALVNVIGMSAIVSFLKLHLPKYYFVSVSAIASVMFVALGAFKVIGISLCIPAILLCVGLFAYFYHKLTNDPNHEKSIDSDDIESTSLLNVSNEVDGNLPFSRIKDVFATALSLISSVAVALILVYWVILSINPFWMRAKRISKYETLYRLPHDANLRVREVSSIADLEFYKNDLLKSFPVVIKPSICTTNSRNVMRCNDYKCLKQYLKTRISEGPLGDGKNGDLGAWVIQEYSDELEGVVFYFKLPYMSQGYIKNIGIRTDSVKGDTSKIPSGKSLKAKYWPETFRRDFSPEFSGFFNDLAEKVPGYSGGRFDIMLPSDELIDPRGVRVLELNVFFLGCIEEKVVKTIFDEFKQLRTSIMQLYIGVVNIVAGYNYLNFFQIALRVPQFVSRTIMCGNHEHMFAKP
jgi:hypothetical protein